MVQLSVGERDRRRFTGVQGEPCTKNGRRFTGVQGEPCTKNDKVNMPFFIRSFPNSLIYGIRCT